MPNKDDNDLLVDGNLPDDPMEECVAMPAPVVDEKIETSTCITLDDLRLSDAGNSERFVSEHGEKVAYAPSFGFLVWDAKRWQRDVDNLTCTSLAKETAYRIYDEANSADDKEYEKLLRHAKRSESIGGIRAMLELAKPDLKVALEEFDSDEYVINTASGVLDLRNENIIPHSPELRLTKYSGVDFDTQAKCPQWLSFIDRVFASDQDVIDYVQKSVGYSLTGDTSEQCVFILVGNGANGKSVLGETLLRLLGTYGTTAEFSTFLTSARDGGGPRNDVARLVGNRFVWASEPDLDTFLSESLVKHLTGGEEVVVRFLYKEHFKYKPRFKLWLATNHLPNIRGVDNGIWRRIRIIPFSVTIPEEERNPKLVDKLAEELPGILNWALEGYQKWRQEGRLVPPSAVRKATAAYRSDQDFLHEFLSEKCEECLNEKIPATLLYEMYCEWCDDNRIEKLSQQKFGRQLTKRGFTRGRISGGKNCWKGLRIRQAVNDLNEVNDYSENFDESEQDYLF